MMVVLNGYGIVKGNSACMPYNTIIAIVIVVVACVLPGFVCGGIRFAAGGQPRRARARVVQRLGRFGP